jgi:uncharacterized protein YbjQ (UPF0145 family)
LIDKPDWDEEENDDSDDLTRLEDLSDFLHEDDPSVDDQLETSEDKEDSPKAEDQGDEDLEFDDEPTVPDIELPPNFNEATSFDEAEDEQDEESEESEEDNEFKNSDDDVNWQVEEESTGSFEPQEEQDFSLEVAEEEIEGESEAEDNTEDDLVVPLAATVTTQEYQSPPQEQKPSVPSTFTKQENFQDLRDFGSAITYGHVSTGGNPPFSIILRNIKYIEDARDILIILKEHGIVTPETQESTQKGLNQGQLLVSQISEYSAIYLAHRFRRFDLDVKIGLSDQLHPSKSYDSQERGLVSRINLRQNHQVDMDFTQKIVQADDIIMVTGQELHQFSILRYLGMIHTHRSAGQQHIEDNDQLNELYDELARLLKNEAHKLQANAVLSIQYQMTALPLTDPQDDITYKVTCTGNAVWAIKNT